MVGRVIRDVVDTFVPSVSMSVYFGSKHVTNDCTLNSSLTSDPPRLLIGSRSNHLYTLVMTDPDAPSPSEPYLREWVHWKGDIIICSTKADVTGSYWCCRSRSRGWVHLSNFNTRRFAEELQLGLPVSAVYFNAQKEPATRTRL